ncbi:MAG: hypothetical protein AB1349_05115 [Elusimicrobiota bacterium]
MGIDKISHYIKVAQQIEKQSNCKIYIVGGFVRDRLLKLNSVDLDFVVEGTGIEVANNFHKKLDGKLTIYKKFLTASLKLKNGFVIDIATARTEKYPKPASMPLVQPASLKEDLLRRDFTINALATPLPTSDFRLPKIIDICSGLEDLKKKQIRVLHKNSFRDDPTRILRAIRYANRLNFKIEKNTEKWLNTAVKKNLLALVSAPRVRDEFLKTLEEKNAKEILSEFKNQKVLKYIDSKLNISAISENKEHVKTRIKKLLSNYTKQQKIAFLKKFCLPKARN